MTEIAMIIKLLDMVHDVLCPFFRDDHNTQDYEKILAKLDVIESLIIQKRDNLNGKK